MANADQAGLWNGHAGHAWVELQGVLDRVNRPVEEHLAEVAAREGARSVLDVGCGTGATTLGVLRRLGPGARAVGVDISEPMLAVARERAAQAKLPATFVRADAQDHPLDAAAFDTVVSRYGVMFFEDPVRAFANLRRATRPGGLLCAVVWRSPAENPFMVAADAVRPLLPGMPPRQPGAPGQFAFADEARVQAILRDSGWQHAAIRPFDFECTLSERELESWSTQLGPVGVALKSADAATRERVAAGLRDAFQPFMQDGEARFAAACAVVEARAPA